MDICDRFWSKVQEPFDAHNDCWVWTSSLNNHGYGQFHLGSGNVLAHVFAYEQFCWRIQDELELDHLCRNPACVNPSHLELVTHQENMRRSPLIKLNGPPFKSHCKRGHPFSGNNLRIKLDGKRVCRTCHRERNNRLYHESRRAKAQPRRGNP
jgi:hypothetical protein